MSTDFGTVCAPKRERLLRLLSDLQWHEPQEMLRYTGSWRFGALVLQLKRMGYQFESQHIPGTNPPQTRFRLVSMVRGEPQPKLVRVYLHEQDADAICYRNEVPVRARIDLSEALHKYRANRHKL